jgi:hypothetical protein
MRAARSEGSMSWALKGPLPRHAVTADGTAEKIRRSEDPKKTNTMIFLSSDLRISPRSGRA